MATITSNGTGGGVASSGDSWAGGVVPVEGDKVIIASTDTITIDGTYVWGDDAAATGVSTTTATGGSVIVNGTIKASRTASSSLTVKGDFVIHTTGTLDYGTEADPIPAAHIATVLLNKSASAASVKYGLITINGAKFYSHGTPRAVNAVLTATADSGQATILVDDATGWAVGDRLYLAPTSICSYVDERTIATITPGAGTAATITLSGNLTYQHLIGGAVGNFTHNVVFKSYAAATPGYIAQQWSNTQPAATRVARYSLFENLGNSGILSTHKWSGWAIRVGATPTTDPSSVKDCSFYTLGNSLSTCVSTHGVRIRTTIMDIACAGNNGVAAIAEASGSVVDWHRTVVYRGTTAINSSYSQGGTTNRHYSCKYYGSSWQILVMSAAVGTEFHDCDFGAANYFAAFDSCFGVKFSNCTIGTTFPIAAPGSYLISNNNYGSAYDILLESCQVQATPIVATVPAGARIQDASATTRVRLSDKNGSPLAQESYFPGGSIIRDDTFARDTFGTSLKFAPYSDATPLSFDLYIYAPYNKPIVVSGYIYANTAYGTTYPVTVSLSGLGITISTWTEDTSVRDSWQQFAVSGTNMTGYNGMLKLTVTAQGAAGGVWVDGVSAPTPLAVNSGEFGYWAQALPAGVVSANFVSAIDVWNSQISDLTLANSIGELLTRMPSAAMNAAAILAAAQITPIEATSQNRMLEAGLTEAEVLRLMAAVLTGKVSGAGTGIERFRDLADTKDRVVVTTSPEGNRTAVVRDGT